MDEAKNSAESQSEIEKLEAEEAAARVNVDVSRLQTLWADEFIVNATENIIYTKDHFLLRIKSGQIRFKSFDRKISRITEKGNVIITTGNESIMPANGPDSAKFVYCSYMNVWVHGADGWQLLGRQVAVMGRASKDLEWVF